MVKDMRRVIDGWYSPALNKHMEIVEYGYAGPAILLLPTAAADYLEYERFLLIDFISKYINEGRVRVFSINSINAESWLNNKMQPRHKAIRHTQFNNYVFNEVLPYIKGKTSAETPIITCGASLGALHAANMFFKRPDLINGTIAMSGNYDLSTYTKGYNDSDVYFNSPMQYLQNLNDDYFLPKLQSGRMVHIMTGSGDYETPEASRTFSALLDHKGISHKLHVWGHDMPHDWDTWRKMLPFILETNF